MPQDGVAETVSERSAAQFASLDIGVSIINFRTAEMTIRCVESVLADIGDLSVHVTIVDNRSDDGSAEAIEAWIRDKDVGDLVSLVRSATNSGFSGGHNQGMAARLAEAWLILNSDALVRPGALLTLLKALRSDERLGIVAPQLEDEDGTPQVNTFRTPGPISELIRAANTGRVTDLLRRWDQPLPPPPPADEIGWVSFACVLLKAEMVRAIGPMDEGYFLYYEDVDYCVTARRAGWTLRYEPHAHVVHLRGGSAPIKKMKAAQQRLPPYYYAARTRCFYKTHGRIGLYACNLAWFLGRGIALSRRLRGYDIPPLIAGHARDLWINALDPLGNRYGPED